MTVEYPTENKLEVLVPLCLRTKLTSVHST